MEFERGSGKEGCISVGSNPSFCNVKTPDRGCSRVFWQRMRDSMAVCYANCKVCAPRRERSNPPPEGCI